MRARRNTAQHARLIASERHVKVGSVELTLDVVPLECHIVRRALRIAKAAAQRAVRAVEQPRTQHVHD